MVRVLVLAPNEHRARLGPDGLVLGIPGEAFASSNVVALTSTLPSITRGLSLPAWLAKTESGENNRYEEEDQGRTRHGKGPHIRRRLAQSGATRNSGGHVRTRRLSDRIGLRGQQQGGLARIQVGGADDSVDF